MPTCELSTDRFGGELWLPELLHEAGLAQSRGQARKDVKGGGVYVNGKRIDDEQHKLTNSDLMWKICVVASRQTQLRRGCRLKWVKNRPEPTG